MTPTEIIALWIEQGQQTTDEGVPIPPDISPALTPLRSCSVGTEQGRIVVHLDSVDGLAAPVSMTTDEALLLVSLLVATTRGQLLEVSHD